MPIHDIFQARRRELASILKVPHWRMLSYGVSLLAPPALLLVLWPRLATNLFATGFGEKTFMPHGVCYFWVPQLWIMHVSTDLLILLCHSADGFNRAAFCFR